ncbi:MAG: DEAD/DEAH box helicase family protein [Ignavibacteria bacterium]
MLYETFNSLKEAHGQDYFTSRVGDEIVQNLNPRFELREYQKEAIGRFDFYITEYRQRRLPSHLLFHMATGSGKTLIMAANILQLYKRGYRNFIFFVNSVNIIEKTRDNFLNPLSEKYLFAPKIKFGEKEVLIKEVQNFEGVNSDNINIIFTTIQGLHTRLNQPRENVLTEEDFEGKDIVLISDEAHHLQTLTRNNKNEKEIEKSWEYTVLKRIFEKNRKNILLEFTATVDLNNPDIRNKYQDKLIFQYDLKQFRLDKYSKEIEVLQASLEPIDRALQAVILSQYRRKIAEKHKILLKPVILFKSKSIKESKENYEKFLTKIKNLSLKDIEKIKSRSAGTDLGKAFEYFDKEKITLDNLINELKIDFSEEKIMLLDSENIDEEKQLKLNSLENPNNEIRAIFAVNMLNEGWDVLNLFDIVRLYDTRDGKTLRDGTYIPGSTTMSEAQLIGRGARYFPFVIQNNDDMYRRKFDDDLDNELRIIETLHYHCKHNPKYIFEIKQTLTKIGILPEKTFQYDLFVKPEIKNKNIWKRGYIFQNERQKRDRSEIFSLNDIHIKNEYYYEFPTGQIEESFLFDEQNVIKSKTNVTEIYLNFLDLGINLIRAGMDYLEFYRFNNLKRYFPNINSINDFILDNNYLSGIKVKIKGPDFRINELTQKDKLNIVLYVLTSISEKLITTDSEYRGTKEFKPYEISKVFFDRKVKYDVSNEGGINPISFNYDWFAQTSFYGTSEERNFLEFISRFIKELKKKYKEVFLFRNERYVKIYNFDDGSAFEPDFILFLVEKQKSSRGSKKRYKSTKNERIISYQIFIEPKGDLFLDANGTFEHSKEGWKEKFLLRLENEAEIFLEFQNSEYKLLGLPFYNQQLEERFREFFEQKLLSR